MKKIILLLTIAFCFAGCQNIEVQEKKVDIINDEFPEAQAELRQIMHEIYKSVQDKDADKLASYHLYSPKFTEFRGGQPRNGAEENKEFESSFVNEVTSFEYSLDDMRITVYGDIAIVTYTSNSNFYIGEESKQSSGQATLVFVKTKDSWKITHEHATPLIIEDE